MKKIILMVLIFASISFAQGFEVISVPMVFDSTTTTSVLDFTDYKSKGYRIAGAQLDSLNSGTTMTLKVSSNNNHYGDLKDVDGSVIGAITVSANSEDIYALTLQNLIPMNYVYVESSATEECTIYLILWKDK